MEPKNSRYRKSRNFTGEFDVDESIVTIWQNYVYSLHIWRKSILTKAQLFQKDEHSVKYPMYILLKLSNSASTTSMGKDWKSALVMHETDLKAAEFYEKKIKTFLSKGYKSIKLFDSSAKFPPTSIEQTISNTSSVAHPRYVSDSPIFEGESQDTIFNTVNSSLVVISDNPEDAVKESVKKLKEYVLPCVPFVPRLPKALQPLMNSLYGIYEISISGIWHFPLVPFQTPDYFMFIDKRQNFPQTVIVAKMLKTEKNSITISNAFLHVQKGVQNICSKAAQQSLEPVAVVNECPGEEVTMEQKRREYKGLSQVVIFNCREDASRHIFLTKRKRQECRCGCSCPHIHLP